GKVGLRGGAPAGPDRGSLTCGCCCCTGGFTTGGASITGFGAAAAGAGFAAGACGGVETGPAAAFTGSGSGCASGPSIRKNAFNFTLIASALVPCCGC